MATTKEVFYTPEKRKVRARAFLCFCPCAMRTRYKI